MDEGNHISVLTTTGRRTGKSHSVTLKAVFYQGRFYFSRRNQNSDWLRNAIANPNVKVTFGDQIVLGKAQLVTDEDLAAVISKLKYDDERAKEKRVVLEVIPSE